MAIPEKKSRRGGLKVYDMYRCTEAYLWVLGNKAISGRRDIFHKECGHTCRTCVR